jgi:hypothetical protein
MVFPIKPAKDLYSRSEVLQRPSPVPKAHGLYAWYFREVPDGVPTEGCLTLDGNTLLYLGIAPDKANKPNSRATLLSRMRHHYCGNAEGSTLRRTLGVLLESKSRFPLRRGGSGKRITLTHAGEQWLDEWMNKNAFIAWTTHPEPWTIEKRLLREISCPLNLADNKHHPFAAVLKKMRTEALQRAKALPIANEDNQTRRIAANIAKLPELLQ